MAGGAAAGGLRGSSAGQHVFASSAPRGADPRGGDLAAEALRHRGRWRDDVQGLVGSAGGGGGCGGADETTRWGEDGRVGGEVVWVKFQV